jgi:hypothetical protein
VEDARVSESSTTETLNRRRIRLKSKAQKMKHFKTISCSMLAAIALALAGISCAHAQGNDNRAPEVPVVIKAPEGNKVLFHVYAEGVQIYSWNGSAWVFLAPEATLFADLGGKGAVGIHYAGPTWESASGSKVVGARDASAPSPNATSIPLLLLHAVTAEGPGIFARTTYIQRVNTLGGVAPSGPGASVGEQARVPYTAEYFFYCAK